MSPRLMRPWPRAAAVVLAVAACFGGWARPATADPGPALAVDVTQDRHAVSPDVYGINFADQALAAELDLPVDRWGGNLMEKYNWQLGSSNFGVDNYFENAADCFIFTDSCAAGNTPYYRTFVARALARSTKPLITLPMLGYVAKDAKTDHPFTCSYPMSTFQAQDGFDQFDAACGNGRNGGATIAGTPTIAGVAVAPSFAKDWVTDLVSRYGSAAAGGVGLYGLGNEPGLWHETHSDMHPAKVTYDELRDKTVALATAVKEADPTARTLGFGEWGWLNYYCSAADDLNDGCESTDPDRAQHGGTPLVNWLLNALQTASATAGKRLLDYIDVHYYAQGYDAANPLDHTGSLWDPTFVDPSWIASTIRLVPAMKEWVAADYPGTKLAITEYNLAITDPIPDRDRINVLIQADTLGILGREGVDLATFFDLTSGTHLAQGTSVADAFRLYRNYDGAHGRFGDVSVRATSADQRRLAVYAAQRTADGALTIVVINKSVVPLTSTLAIPGFTAAGPARTLLWTGSGIQTAPATTLDGRVQNFPARSMTLYVVAPSSTPPAPGPGGTSPGSGGTQPPGGGTPASPLPSVGGRVRASFRPGRRFTRVTRLAVLGLPKSARVRVSCRGSGCPRRGATMREKGGVVRATSLFARRRLRPGARIALRLTAPQRTGRQVTFTTRRSKAPRRTEKRI